MSTALSGRDENPTGRLVGVILPRLRGRPEQTTDAFGNTHPDRRGDLLIPPDLIRWAMLRGSSPENCACRFPPLAVGSPLEASADRTGVLGDSKIDAHLG